VEIDAYHACPCHSEKKIKFCCGKEIVNDLNQLVNLQQAGQELAALDECERAIKRHGPQDCLLTMKTQLLIAHGDLDKALEVNAQFLAKNPHHPAGYHQLALLRLEKRDVAGAVDALQDAVDAVKGNEMPVFLATGFRMVGIALLVTGFPLAARAHFEFAISLVGEEDEELKKFYLRTLLGPGLSFSQRVKWSLPNLTERDAGQEWAKKIVTAGRGLSRGQFRKSLKYLELAGDTFPNEKILESIAVVSTYLNEGVKSRKAWSRFAEADGLAEGKAIQATVMANHFLTAESFAKIASIDRTVEISDFGAALEHALSLNLLQAIEVSEISDEDGTPPPRNGFVVLDRPQPKGLALTAENTPTVVGTVVFYGKQTDREARMVWQFRQVPEFFQSIESIQSEFSQWGMGSPVEEVVDEEMVPFDLLMHEWSIPPDVSPIERSRLVRQLVKQRLNDWLETSVSMLDGKTPREAACEIGFQRVLKAILISFQFDLLSFELDEESFDELWGELGLAKPASTKLEGRKISELTPVELMFLPLEDLDNEQLMEIFISGFSRQLRPLVRRVLKELLQRPDSDQLMAKHDLLQHLAVFATDLGDALELFAQARTKAAQAGMQVGNYLVDEFEFRLSRGITDKLEELLSVIYQAHLQEPEVPERMTMILHRYGLTAVPNDPTPARSKSLPRAPSSSSIITSEESSPASSTPSKLWLPD
jgi:tetratricopeptide (TPR) repeat protein